jgi:hypothetical protein
MASWRHHGAWKWGHNGNTATDDYEPRTNELVRGEHEDEREHDFRMSNTCPRWGHPETMEINRKPLARASLPLARFSAVQPCEGQRSLRRGFRPIFRAAIMARRGTLKQRKIRGVRHAHGAPRARVRTPRTNSLVRGTWACELLV